MESEAWRYPKRPGLSIGDDVAEYGDVRGTARTVSLVVRARVRASDRARRTSPCSATSSPMEDPGRFGYLHTSLSALSQPDALSGLDIAISRDLQ